MKITFLGTSSGTPSRSRNVSAIGLQLVQQGKLWLFDCGEGTQHQVLRSPLRLSQLDRIFITHMHGDHLYGLPGLLASRSLSAGASTPVTIYGPNGLNEFLRVVFDRSQTRPGYPVRVEVLRPGTVYEDNAFEVVCASMAHRIESYGFAVIEKTQTGHFDVEQATALGIPPGPVFGQLKRGETVVLPDGRTIDGKTLVGPPLLGRKVVYAGDTGETSRAAELARGADLLIHEATYLSADAELAVRGAHSTAAIAATVAKEAGVETLILTHISPRYDTDAGSRLPELLAEAQAIFPNTYLARDFWSFDVPRREPSAATSM
ncbi:MAG: RNAse [Chthonomonadaceae bacterium]|nr:RNAse [Chthonomonadaceae bacterium]